MRNIPGVPFKEAVVTCDDINIVVLAADKVHREALFAFNSNTGEMVSKVPLRYSGVKVKLLLKVYTSNIPCKIKCDYN